MTVPMAPSMLSATTWRRLRAGTTAALLAAATVAGVGLAVNAPAVSPVAPVPQPTVMAAAPDVPEAAAPDVPQFGAPHAGHGGHR